MLPLAQRWWRSITLENRFQSSGWAKVFTVERQGRLSKPNSER